MTYVLTRSDRTIFDFFAQEFVPVDTEDAFPHPFKTEDEAEAYFTSWMEAVPERSLAGTVVEPVDVEIDFTSAKFPEAAEATPEPKPAPAGTLWLLDGRTGDRVVAIEDNATLPRPASGTFTVEAEVETSGKVQLEGAGQNRNEGKAPYILHGDTKGVPLSSSPAEGEYEVFAIYEDKELRRRFRF